jgi:hypothetical protein
MSARGARGTVALHMRARTFEAVTQSARCMLEVARGEFVVSTVTTEDIGKHGGYSWPTIRGPIVAARKDLQLLQLRECP